MIDSLKKQLTQVMIQNNKDITAEEVQDANIIDNSELISATPKWQELKETVWEI